ncbi:NAD(P)-dependent dehydrogenase (short-subunit alcohol dehydrogenase family) [Microbacteriaceae bacterium SG_E_30_P1]|uniref:NAD(P)-dependent dehydrogenase (Short-subunit alcohol dehydrogenase family) n=1 Tax=Antiquaquibacter oligotrophicus TaxID=2880260 RepID=A0ABT6KSV4_9MICO|nr:SDR family oxidoreductase [Antiquaquibacter oligotrophicus]MDH6182588.1 NAD(P)-dependent dehydrogenase (short-subunit alcohol dehydrogenase family) [Antiquaquibacter oligotrophicus]UDF14445.1 SDR family oxidoreductase [Antiquaquibacter oligotrophicus]
MSTTDDPRDDHPADGFDGTPQSQPGLTGDTNPAPDHGESSYVGTGKLTGRRALITGGDSGIGRAVAIAFAREGADVAIVHLPEEQEDAASTAELIAEAGRKALLIPGDARDEKFCVDAVEQTVAAFGGLDILIPNAAYQKDRDGIENLETAEFQRVIETNLYSMLWFTRAAVPHLEPGSSIIVTSSIQAFSPSPGLVDYAMTKAAQVAFVRAMSQELGERGIRVNAVAPGPIWTPLIPATDWPEKVEEFGKDTPLGRPGQPAELAPAYVLLASDDGSYMSGGVIPVTGGKPL